MRNVQKIFAVSFSFVSLPPLLFAACTSQLQNHIKPSLCSHKGFPTDLRGGEGKQWVSNPTLDGKANIHGATQADFLQKKKMLNGICYLAERAWLKDILRHFFRLGLFLAHMQSCLSCPNDTLSTSLKLSFILSACASGEVHCREVLLEPVHLLSH